MEGQQLLPFRQSGRFPWSSAASTRPIARKRSWAERSLVGCGWASMTSPPPAETIRQRATQEADRLFDDLATQATTGIHAKRRLERMIQRLELDDDIVSEDVLLNAIDLSDPVIDELCLLADGLRDFG